MGWGGAGWDEVGWGGVGWVGWGGIHILNVTFCFAALCAHMYYVGGLWVGWGTVWVNSTLIQPDGAHARTKRNDFPVGFTPPQPPILKNLIYGHAGLTIQLSFRLQVASTLRCPRLHDDDITTQVTPPHHHNL